MKPEKTVEKKLRVALFGAGKMALHHARAIGLQEDAILVAVADPAADPAALRENLRMDIPVFSRGEELLNKIEPDLVHVCTPPETHASLASLALSRGAHVYVEKPFALNLREAQDVLSMAKGRGRKVCAGHQLLYESPALRSLDLLKVLGKPVYVESYFSFRPVRRSRDGRSTISPLDQLVDILPHPVYLLLHFMRGSSYGGVEAQVETRALEVRATGLVRGLFQCGDVSGNLVVTLEGRPVESYLRVVGTNGCLTADFVRGTAVALPGPGTSGISKVINPYSQSWQTFTKTTRALSARLFKKQKSYPGLAEILRAFYGSVRMGSEPPVSYASILETVAICEETFQRLKRAEAEEGIKAEASLKERESELPSIDSSRGGVLVTGGTGMLGKAVAAELRGRKRSTRVVSRKIPPASERIPGVEYVAADLGEDVSPVLFDGIDLVIHCAAETAGGKEAHMRNSIGATRNLIRGMGKAGVSKFLHISSLAVLRSSRETGKPVDETTPLVQNSEERGPYVWGKAESERLAIDSSRKNGIKTRIIRPGPLVNFDAFEPPGRLGREVGSLFVYIGGRRSEISLCSVQTAAEVIGKYVENFESMPPVLNLIEPKAPTRAELVSILLNNRPDLKAFRIPFIFLRVLSPGLKLLQRILRPSQKPIDIYAAFASERYKPELASEIINR